MKIEKLAKPLQYLLGLMVLLTILSGIILRILYLTPLGQINFIHFMHAHSHLAILGWIYPALMALFLGVIIDGKKKIGRGGTTIYVVTQGINFLMFVAFAAQGYALYSIIFSSLHIILSYIFIYYFILELKKNKIHLNTTAGLFIKGSIFVLLLGSFGPWILAYWNGAGLEKNFIYDLLVHTFLHFQINGWITLALLGVILFIIEREGGEKRRRSVEFGFWLYAVALLPSIILNVDWTVASSSLLVVAVIGWVLKMSGIGLILFSMLRMEKLERSFTGWSRIFLMIGMIALLAKTAVEVGNTIPPLIPFAMYTRNIVVGYLHLGLIGFASFTIISIFLKVNWLDRNPMKLFALIISFILYEILLFGDGLLSSVLHKPIPHIHLWLLIVSIILGATALSLLIKKRNYV